MFPAILPVIVSLILRKRASLFSLDADKNSEAGKTVLEKEESVYKITKIFLSDLVLLLNHSKDNRR